MLAGDRQRVRDIAAKGDFNRIRTALAHKRVRPSAAKQGYVGAARSNRQYNGRDGSGHRPGPFVLTGTLPIFAPPVDWRARSTPLPLVMVGQELAQRDVGPYGLRQNCGKM